MKHYLSFHDDKSDKFWQIEVSENTFTVPTENLALLDKHRLKPLTIRKSVLKKQKIFTLKNKKKVM